jgi:hypothetical protein
MEPAAAAAAAAAGPDVKQEEQQMFPFVFQFGVVAAVKHTPADEQVLAASKDAHPSQAVTSADSDAILKSYLAWRQEPSASPFIGIVSATSAEPNITSCMRAIRYNPSLACDDRQWYRTDQENLAVPAWHTGASRLQPSVPPAFARPRCEQGRRALRVQSRHIAREQSPAPIPGIFAACL